MIWMAAAASSSTLINCCSLTGLSDCAAPLEASVCHPSNVFVLFFVWQQRSLLELIHSLHCPWSVCRTSSKWPAGSVKQQQSLSVLMVNKCSSATYKRQPLCTDNTEPHRKACEIIIIIIIITVDSLIVILSATVINIILLIIIIIFSISSWDKNSYMHLKSWENRERWSIPAFSRKGELKRKTPKTSVLLTVMQRKCQRGC